MGFGIIFEPGNSIEKICNVRPGVKHAYTIVILVIKCTTVSFVIYMQFDEQADIIYVL
jgi:hypothetical protein